MNPRRELSAAEIEELLVALGARLDAQGASGTLYIVGGAAMALEFDRRRITVDVDAILDPPATIRAEAERLAIERDLPADWLNSNAAAFIPGGDDQAVKFETPGLSIALASPTHLLAMKMARGTDIDDLMLLFAELEIATPEQAADIALEVYGSDSIVLAERDELILLAAEILTRLPGLR